MRTFKRSAPPLLIVAASAVVTLPAWLLYGLAATGDDGITHASQYVYFSRQFWAGELFPRWLPDLNGGLGSPVHFYYPPLPFHVASLLAPLWPAGTSPLRPLGVVAALTVAASGLTMRLWLKQTAGEAAATFGALVYVLAPYHVALDLFTRDAYSELFAFVWMPLVLLFAPAGGPPGRATQAGLAASYAALALSHLPATLLFSPLAPARVLFTTGRGRRVRALTTTLAAMICGAALAAIYLVPAVATRGYAQLGKTAGYDYRDHWVTFARASLHTHGGKILWGVLTTAALVACAAAASRRRRDAASRRERLFWLAVSVASVLMMTPLSAPVWRLVPVLQNVQFPWRINLILCLAASALAAQGFDALRVGGAARGLRLKVFACLVLACWLALTYAAARQAYPNRETIKAFTAALHDGVKRGLVDPLFAPASVVTHDFESVRDGFCAEGLRPAREICVTRGEGTAAVEIWRPREIVLRASSAGGMTVRIMHYYYEGWTARVGGREQPLRPAEASGLMQLDLPAGEHRVVLRLERGPAESAGQLISASAALLLVAWLALPKLREKSASVRGRRAAAELESPTRQG